MLTVRLRSTWVCLYRADNPMEFLVHRQVQEQKEAQALAMIEMRKRLRRINRESEAGQRDYTLLSAAPQKAARAQAL
jgi:hypothetical protein